MTLWTFDPATIDPDLLSEWRWPRRVWEWKRFSGISLAVVLADAGGTMERMTMPLGVLLKHYRQEPVAVPCSSYPVAGLKEL